MASARRQAPAERSVVAMLAGSAPSSTTVGEPTEAVPAELATSESNEGTGRAEPAAKKQRVAKAGTRTKKQSPEELAAQQPEPAPSLSEAAPPPSKKREAAAKKRRASVKASANATASPSPKKRPSSVKASANATLAVEPAPKLASEGAVASQTVEREEVVVPNAVVDIEEAVAASKCNDVETEAPDVVSAKAAAEEVGSVPGETGSTQAVGKEETFVTDQAAAYDESTSAPAEAVASQTVQPPTAVDSEAAVASEESVVAQTFEKEEAEIEDAEASKSHAVAVATEATDVVSAKAAAEEVGSVPGEAYEDASAGDDGDPLFVGKRPLPMHETMSGDDEWPSNWKDPEMSDWLDAKLDSLPVTGNIEIDRVVGKEETLVTDQAAANDELTSSPAEAVSSQTVQPPTADDSESAVASQEAVVAQTFEKEEAEIEDAEASKSHAVAVAT